MSSEFQYLFPFELIRPNSKVLIYGAGELGIAYVEQLLLTNYAKVVGIVDRRWQEYQEMYVSVYSPSMIANLVFDYVVVALKTQIYLDDILLNLCKAGIDKERIVFVGVRTQKTDIFINSNNNIVSKLAYNIAPISIAMQFGGGLGDAIIKKKFILEIIKKIPNLKIDIYAPLNSDFFNAVYRDVSEINCLVNDSGALYQSQKGNYCLAMQVFHMLRIDNMNIDKLRCYSPDFATLVEKAERNIKEYALTNFPSEQDYLHYGRMRLHGYNIYGSYNYSGLVHIEKENWRVSIPQPTQDIVTKFNNMKLGEYITFNYGNGTTSKSNKELNNKQWPAIYFEETIKLFKQAHPNVKILQLGDKTTDRIEGADEYILGENFDMVKCLLKGAIIHLDTEGALVHLATQLGTRCVVIFGSSPVDIFAYSDNINLKPTECGGCIRLYGGSFACPLKKNPPACLSSIKVYQVVKSLDDCYKKYKFLLG